jgi:sugar-phosphatase
VWRRWAGERGYDAERFLRLAHGRRISETLRAAAPELDWRRETAVLDAMEETETEGLIPVPAAGDLLASLPPARWAVVTSGSRVVAQLRLVTTGLPVPSVFITGEDVRRGKPDPEPYRLGATRLGLPPADCVVLEDAPPGIAAAKAAGMRVIALPTTHSMEQLTHADVRIAGLSAIRVSAAEGVLRLQLMR